MVNIDKLHKLFLNEEDYPGRGEGRNSKGKIFIETILRQFKRFSVMVLIIIIITCNG